MLASLSYESEVFTGYFDSQSNYWAVGSKFYKLLLDSFHDDYI